MRTMPTRVESRYELIRKLVRTSAPVISLYLHASPPWDAERRQQSVRWSALRRTLAQRGAADADLERLDEAVHALPAGDRVLAALVSKGELWESAQLERSDETDDAVLDTWPRVIPLLRWQQQQIPTVAAVVHHGEAEVSVYRSDAAIDLPVTHELIAGPDDEIERNAPGGWSQGRYRRRAQDSWANNATEFAAEIARLANSAGARILALTGDPREVQLVLDRLPSDVRGVSRTDVRPKAGPNASVRIDDEDVWRLMRDTARRERRLAVARFDDAGGQGKAVEGVSEVRRVLTSGAVARLLVVNGHVSDELDELDELVALAIDTDAEIVVLEADEITLVGGVGAVLRF